MSDSGSSSSASSGSSSTCSVHGNPVVVYCRDCQTAVCGPCLTDGSHHKHAFDTLKNGYELQIEAVTKGLKNLKTSRLKQTVIKSQATNAKKKLEEMFNLAKENVAEQYRELRELMDQNMQQAFLLIQALQESMIEDMDQLVNYGEEYEEKCKNIKRNVKDLKRTQDADDGVRILEIEEVETGIEEMEDYHRNISKMLQFDSRRLKALEDSISRIVKMNKKLLPRPWEFGENITFDEHAAHELLKISGDNTTVKFGASQSFNRRQKHKQTETVFNVLASQSFTEGSHYWEVNVKNTECWTVGVVEKSWVKKGIRQTLGQDRRSWVLQMDGYSLVALHNDDTTMIREAVIEQLGIFLDFKKGILQFFNVHSGNALHTFVSKFKNPLFPAFSIELQKGSKPVMKLCALLPRGMGSNDVNDERRLSTDSGIERAMNRPGSDSGQSMNQSREEIQSDESRNAPSQASDQSSDIDQRPEML